MLIFTGISQSSIHLCFLKQPAATLLHCCQCSMCLKHMVLRTFRQNMETSCLLTETFSTLSENVEKNVSSSDNNIDQTFQCQQFYLILTILYFEGIRGHDLRHYILQLMHETKMMKNYSNSFVSDKLTRT